MSDISLDPKSLPRHVAIIMDGNGRWAKSRGLERIEGHRAGAKSVRAVTEECRRLGIRYLTLFSFSTENWGRPEDEVSGLMKLFRHYLDSELSTLLENGVRLRAIGDLERLPYPIRTALFRTMESTKSNNDLDLVLAVSYGGREEIVSACRRVVQLVKEGSMDVEDIRVDTFGRALWTEEIPDPDLLIRSSGEMRISNFLLWQLAYAEIVVTPEFWPEFDSEVFRRCLAEYARRERRFGLVEGQKPCASE